MAQKPSIPKGTRDFLPIDVAKRNYLFSVLKKYFDRYAFQPIETPSFELNSTLMGKYGEEGDRLIFKILNSGEKVKKADLDALHTDDLKRFSNSLSEKSLRYDLTVPFARFVVQHQNELTFPFKRYQIQPVWRADRPQHGRYQEFYQCDADVVGNDSLWHEVDLVLLMNEVFQALGIHQITIHLNNRKILSGLAEWLGVEDRLIDLTIALDKLDKIGEEGVAAELLEKGFHPEVVDQVRPLFQLNSAPNEEKIEILEQRLKNSEVGTKGIAELKEVMRKVLNADSKVPLVVDITLARGLNYYTGAIFEVKPHGVKMGTIAAGGRYDDLTGLFGMKNMSGVGISFGADRIFDVMNALSLFPESVTQPSGVLLVNFGGKEADKSFEIVQKLREKGISAELYPDAAKLQKQLKYANDRGYRQVVLIGEQELTNGTAVLKDMESGEQKAFSWQELIESI